MSFLVLARCSDKFCRIFYVEKDLFCRFTNFIDGQTKLNVRGLAQVLNRDLMDFLDCSSPDSPLLTFPLSVDSIVRTYYLSQRAQAHLDMVSENSKVLST